MSGEVVLDIDELTIRFGERTVVDGVRLRVRRGEIVALVGESGSGKSLTARSVLGLLPATATAAGTVRLADTDIVGATEAQLRAVRGTTAAMVFQEPQTALNPVQKIGTQLVQALRAHGVRDTKTARARAVELLAAVDIPEPEQRLGWYPHQLSGGQKQRVVIALALSGDPDLLIADEPTTALDVTVQAEILDLLRSLQRERGTAVLFITHNLGVVAEIADRVVVLRAGRVVEEQSVFGLFAEPGEEYTRTLLASVPRLPGAEASAVGSGDEAGRSATDLAGRDDRSVVAGDGAAGRADGVGAESGSRGSETGRGAADPVVARGASAREGGRDDSVAGSDHDAAGDRIRPRGVLRRVITRGPAVVAEKGGGTAEAEYREVLRVEDLSVVYPGRHGAPSFPALHDISLTLGPREVLGVVGESGSGKSTLGRTALGLVPATSGTVTLQGVSLAGLSPREVRALRRNVALVHQDVSASLDPRRSVADAIGEPLAVHRVASGSLLRSKVGDLLESVRLPRDYADRRPGELSGGQRQRVALARALALAPRLLVADEPTSALDVSVQAQVLDLFADLRAEYGFASLFISHDLAVVHQVADRVVVLRQGRIVESGAVGTVFAAPAQEYTRRLLDAVPTPDPTARRVQAESVAPALLGVGS
ncbi:glutathione ABC transporter ATP-binding protein [Nocardia neocaledoniensis NBRC 108232]|uniref:Peptide/nickel transport system ATP-binding protein n=1 Tax=Nocardia neocaledoniensis TaxID=236511 RepID=A0A317NYJ1_9NOCA|nr:ABC transporter ATP-binding protein [Nocardia neocaledoniensis]PWV79214.1 peptide/nickel transport system ATP-binding protein [Nocardia neocaledoniensis]GEM34960.1 glutathione ABC transporter ATP-binding protein [Nocardia neocaledoniensis NBRC 108232]